MAITDDALARFDDNMTVTVAALLLKNTTGLSIKQTASMNAPLLLKVVTYMEGIEELGDVGVAIALTVRSTRVVAFTTRKADGNVKFKLKPTALFCKDKETLTGFSAKFRHSAVVAALVLTLARPKTTMLRMGD